MPEIFIQYADGLLVNSQDFSKRAPAPSFNPPPEAMTEVRVPVADGAEDKLEEETEPVAPADVADPVPEAKEDTAPAADAAPEDAPAAE